MTDNKSKTRLAVSDAVTSRDEFVELFAESGKFSTKRASELVDLLLGLVVSEAQAGRAVRLDGFGRFYPQKHRGHRVQFAGDNARIPDYMVMKFSADREINKLLDEAVPEGPQQDTAGEPGGKERDTTEEDA